MSVSGSSAAFRVEAAVIGAGVVGLATARALSLRGKEVLILERSDTIGSGEFVSVLGEGQGGSRQLP